MNKLKKLVNIGTAAALALALSGPVFADNWPSAPIKLVVPWAAGGSTDTLARILGESISKSLNQSVIVENKAGAGGTIGSQAVAASKADGYTFLLGVSGDQVNAEFIYPKLNYSPREDLMPVALVASESVMMAANAKLGVKNAAEVAALAKQRNLSIATSGHGSNGHLSSMLFTQKAGVEATVVPYKGAAPAVNDTLAGHTQLVVGTPATVIQHVEAGNLVPIAVTTEKRIDSLPGVPTFKESGIDFTITTYYMVAAPKGTPADIVKKMSATVEAVLQEPKLIAQFKQIGVQPDYADSQKLTQILSVERAKVGETMKLLPPPAP